MVHYFQIILNIMFFCQSVCLLTSLPKLDKGISPVLDEISFWNFFETFLRCWYTVSKKIQKDITSRTGDIPLSNFGKKVSKQTDWQTYMKIRIIWNNCTNIQGMSIKNFRKISHTELFWNSVPTSQECLKKNQQDISSRTWDIPIFV